MAFVALVYSLVSLEVHNLVWVEGVYMRVLLVVAAVCMQVWQEGCKLASLALVVEVCMLALMEVVVCMQA